MCQVEQHFGLPITVCKYTSGLDNGLKPLLSAQKTGRRDAEPHRTAARLAGTFAVISWHLI